MSAPLRAVLVDDEPLARRRLTRLLGDVEGVEVVGEAANATEALALVEAQRPDLLFLDIQMPGLDGFALAEALEEEGRPFLVFVTAHAGEAARAFDAEAADFLVKPVEPARLARAVERARRRRGTPADHDWRPVLEQLLAAARAPAARYLDRFAVTHGRRIVYVAVEDVDWIEQSGNYARLHVGRQVHLVRVTMQKLDEVLDPRAFARIHRSTIVRVDRIRELVTILQGEYRVVLADGTQLEVMRTYRDRLPGRIR